MSLAKVNRIGRVRKVAMCEKCGDMINVGDPAVKFAVGFRGRTRVRCAKAACFPKPSERESSLVAEAYAAQESVDLSTAETLEDLQAIRDEVAEAVRDVAEQYEDSEMFDKNPDLQERADTLNGAADELERWEPEDDEPEQDGDGVWNIAGEDYSDFEEAHAVWLDAARESLENAIDGMELP